MADRLTAALADRYRIEREIGAGGMATVYLAQDLKHDRKVALKVLKPELAAVVGAERFLAEIKTTANLQHPHILPLFDSGAADSFLFYVMPYVNGESLRERLDREKQLSIAEAVRIAAAVANALEHAHRLGVIHRDIKPANILLQDGEPVVADFGIALAVGTAGGGRLTETGLSLGTPYYMSPEQATGDQRIGAQTDVYALGCVLYEMLVGAPPYAGGTAQAVLGKIIGGAPVSPAAERATIPANVDAAIRRALEKVPADRFASAQEFAKALGDPGFRHGPKGLGEGGAVRRWRRIAAGFAVATGLVALLAGWAVLRPTPTAVLPLERYSSPFLDGQAPVVINTAAFNLSRDGTMLVYRHPTADGGEALWIRRWDALAAAPIAGTAGAINPSISPDGREVLFSAAGRIQVLSLEGGSIRNLGAGGYPRWGPDGYVYAQIDSGTIRIPAPGGAPERVTRRGAGEFAGVHRVEDFLPGGKTALLTVSRFSGDIEIRALDLESGVMSPLAAGRYPRYARSGHLLFLSPEGSLMAAPFDPGAGELLGPAVAVIDEVWAYTISDTGKLFYSVGGAAAPRELVWVTRSGQATSVDPDWRLSVQPDANLTGGNWGLSLSPDGTRVAVGETTSAGSDIWIKELDGGPRSRLTFTENGAFTPSWANDSTVTFLARHQGGMDVWSQRADGTGEAELVFDSERSVADARVSSNGEWLLLRTAVDPGLRGGRDILALRRGVDTIARALLTADHDETDPRLSPDGRWLAYTSLETGRAEVFVRSFPDMSRGKWQISTNGGNAPLWAHSGRELFFKEPSTRRLLVAAVEAAPGFRVTSRAALFEIPVGYQFDMGAQYEIAPDDQRFLMARRHQAGDEEPGAPNTILINNFFAELEARVRP